MKNRKFRYALEPVLLKRQWDRDALLADLGGANSAVADFQKKLEQLENEISAVANDWNTSTHLSTAFTVDQLRIVSSYLQNLTSQRDVTKQALAEKKSERNALAEQVYRSQKALDAVEVHKKEMHVAFCKAQMNRAFKEADDHWSTLQEVARFHD